MFKNLPYKIRYAELEPNSIFNMCGPEHSSSPKWDEKGLAEQKKSAIKYVDKLNKRNGFYIKLEKSIRAKGIVNPILVNAGFCQPRKVFALPPEMKDDPNNILFCHSNGGSRLWVAAKLNMKIIPCIVCDFNNIFENEIELKSEEEFYDKYPDKPTGVNFGEFGITIKRLYMIHLKDYNQ